MLACLLLAAAGDRASPQTVDPNIGARIEQTVPSASERLLNELRENPPHSSAPVQKTQRHRSSRSHKNSTGDQPR